MYIVENAGVGGEAMLVWGQGADGPSPLVFIFAVKLNCYKKIKSLKKNRKLAISTFKITKCNYHVQWLVERQLK